MLLVRWRLWLPRAVCHSSLHLGYLGHDGAGLVFKPAGGESIEDVLLGRGAWVKHVVREEAVVTQVVHHNLVRREVPHKGHVVRDRVHGGEEVRLAPRGLRQPVPGVAHGAHRRHHLQLVVQRPAGLQCRGEALLRLQRREEHLLEEVRGHLVAVGDHLSGGLEAPDIGRADRDDEDLGFPHRAVCSQDALVHRAQGHVLLRVIKAAVVQPGVVEVPVVEQVVLSQRLPPHREIQRAGN
mmetsp:Transcript_7586/g.25695  ORF Transcript_7586/g.25695 Transcript_7586/m.25695 type:complete len:239 (+) Transcript_7586:252-968(+)